MNGRTLFILLTLAFAAVQATPQSQPSTSSFEVASVKLNRTNERARMNATPAAGRLVITGMTVKQIIQGAYSVQPFEIVSAESPVLSQRIDIEAKTEHPVGSTPQLQQMLQPILAERFKLAAHREMREMNALVLALANKGGHLGPKMKQAEKTCEQATCGAVPSGVGRIVGKGIDMPALVGLIGPSQRLPVIDQTGLQGRYDIDVTYTPEPFSAAALAQRGGAPPPGVNVDPNGPALFDALRDQLGLRVEPRKMLVPVLVIDHIEPLSEN